MVGSWKQRRHAEGNLYSLLLSKKMRVIKMRRTIIASIILAGISFNPVMGAQMAIWDFGQSSGYYTEAPTAENVVGTPTIVLSGGLINANGKNGVAYLDAAGVSHIAGQAAGWDDVKVDGPDAELDVTINTAGWQDISVRFDYKAWDPTTTSFDLDYRLSETAEWGSILDNQTIIADKVFHSFAFSFAGDIDNQSFVQFRLNDLDKNGNKDFAFDNLEFTGTPIPEPATILLLGLGIAAVRRNHRK
jgi:hypothetical protein